MPTLGVLGGRGQNLGNLAQGQQSQARKRCRRCKYGDSAHLRTECGTNRVCAARHAALKHCAFRGLITILDAAAPPDTRIGQPWTFCTSAQRPATNGALSTRRRTLPAHRRACNRRFPRTRMRFSR
eukprot:8360966-Pyramimonas_sp.AAC.1